MNGIWRRLGLILLSSAALMACSDSTTEHAHDTHLRPVKITTVESGMPERIRRFPAVVEATQSADLTFRVGGELTRLSVRPGQQVEQGHIIATLDPTDYQLALEQAEARAELAEAQFKRIERLLAERIVSQADFDQARAERQIARANLNTATANLSYTQLKAPFAGTVASLHVETFENIAPQQAIITLQTDDLVDVAIQVPERLFAWVRRDTDYQPEVRFDSVPGVSFRGQLREWDRIADPATNTYRVVFSLPKPEAFNILPGMTAQVIIDSTHLLPYPANAVTIPIHAVFSPAEGRLLEQHQAVWVYTPTSEYEGTVSLRAVRLAESTTQSVVITEGLYAGEQVVTAGVHQLHEGQRVRIWARERGL